MSSVITSQPRTQELQENQKENVNSALGEENQEEVKTALRKEVGNTEREETVEEFCCCVLDSAEDEWCLCRCISACFRGIGHCTNDFCEACSECITTICENSGDISVPADSVSFCSDNDDCYYSDGVNEMDE